jgi:4-nitrophenyl phosphatase
VTLPSWPPAPGGTWILDLDGVVWLSGEPIEGAPEAVAHLRASGVRTLFVTNNSAPTVAELVGRLERAGIPARPTDLVTSAQAAATVVPLASRVVVLADEGVREALADRQVTVVDEGPADVVLVGWTHRFDFDRLAVATAAIRAGALLVATNDDPTHPSPQGLLPGAGALVAAVATASGAHPLLAGKPYPALVDLVAARAADLRAVVGDRATTDGALAGRLGVPFALVLSGVTSPTDAPAEPTPSATARNLGKLVQSTLGHR